jgi:hypothetical protein
MSDDLDKIGQHFYDNFYKFSKEHFEKRFDRSTDQLNEAFKLKWDFGSLSGKPHKECSWPGPQILAGENTNLHSVSKEVQEQ